MRVSTTQRPGDRFRAPTARNLASLAGLAALAAYTDECRRFFQCVGLNVQRTGTMSDPVSGFSQNTYSVNGKPGWTEGDICGSPVTTAGRFGVPWSPATTQWSRIRQGQPCTYDPNVTVQTGSGQEARAPDSAPSPSRGSAESPSLPMTAPLLLDAYQEHCGLSWERAQTPGMRTAADEACMVRVKAGLESQGYGGSTGEDVTPLTQVPATVTPTYAGDPVVQVNRAVVESQVGLPSSAQATGAPVPQPGLLDSSLSVGGTKVPMAWVLAAGAGLYLMTRKK